MGRPARMRRPPNSSGGSSGVVLVDCLAKERRLERAMGIEPTQPAWKAGALPLSYARADRFAPARAPEGIERAEDRAGSGDGGQDRIRTCEGCATRFTVWPLWPLGYLPDPSVPASCFLENGRSLRVEDLSEHEDRSWDPARAASNGVLSGASDGSRTHNPPLTRRELFR